jgi:hypothetical protein
MHITRRRIDSKDLAVEVNGDPQIPSHASRFHPKWRSGPLLIRQVGALGLVLTLVVFSGVDGVGRVLSRTNSSIGSGQT